MRAHEMSEKERKELLEEAKRRYPIGTVFLCAEHKKNRGPQTVDEELIWEKNVGISHAGILWVWFNGWGEILVLPESHMIKENWYTGDNGQSRWLFKYNGFKDGSKTGMHKACTLPDGENTISGGIIGNLKDIRPAEPDLVNKHFPGEFKKNEYDRFIVGKWYTGLGTKGRYYAKLASPVKCDNEFPCKEYINIDDGKYTNNGTHFGGIQHNIVEANMADVNLLLPTNHKDKMKEDESQYWIRECKAGRFLNKYILPVRKGVAGNLLAYLQESEKKFVTRSHAEEDGTFTLPTREDIFWLDECIRLDKYISKEASKGEPDPSNIGRYLVALKDEPSGIGPVNKGDYVKIAVIESKFYKVALKRDKYVGDSGYVVAYPPATTMWDYMPIGWAPYKEELYNNSVGIGLPEKWCVELKSAEDWKTIKLHPPLGIKFVGNAIGSYYCSDCCVDACVRPGFVVLTMDEFRKLVLYETSVPITIAPVSVESYIKAKTVPSVDERNPNNIKKGDWVTVNSSTSSDSYTLLGKTFRITGEIKDSGKNGLYATGYREQFKNLIIVAESGIYLKDLRLAAITELPAYNSIGSHKGDSLDRPSPVSVDVDVVNIKAPRSVSVTLKQTEREISIIVKQVKQSVKIKTN